MSITQLRFSNHDRVLQPQHIILSGGSTLPSPRALQNGAAPSIPELEPTYRTPVTDIYGAIADLKSTFGADLSQTRLDLQEINYASLTCLTFRCNTVRLHITNTFETSGPGTNTVSATGMGTIW